MKNLFQFGSNLSCYTHLLRDDIIHARQLQHDCHLLESLKVLEAEPPHQCRQCTPVLCTRSLFSIGTVIGLFHAWLNHLSQLSHLFLESWLLGNENISDAALSLFTRVHLNIGTVAACYMCMVLSSQLRILENAWFYSCSRQFSF